MPRRFVRFTMPAGAGVRDLDEAERRIVMRLAKRIGVTLSWLTVEPGIVAMIEERPRSVLDAFVESVGWHFDELARVHDPTSARRAASEEPRRRLEQRPQRDVDDLTRHRVRQLRRRLGLDPGAPPKRPR